MKNLALFRGFNDSERQKMLKCLGAKIKNCNTNETIMLHKEAQDYLYVVLSGTAEFASYDYDGNKSVLERYSAGAVFGDMFFNALGNDQFMASATSPCKILYFHYQSALTPCENLCEHHTKFISNLFYMISEKLISQTQHIEILTRRSIREKLIAYFQLQELKNGSFSFVLPMSLSSLSNYLGVDRSAMQREIKRLNNEGIIESKGKKIILIKNSKKAF